MPARWKYIYRFAKGKADGHGGMKDTLGGKGAGLAEMTRSGVSVPAGFTIATSVCRYYLKKLSLPTGFATEFRAAVAWLEKITGKRFGDPQNPLLVSVRSGAKFSMPGMMDTILNLGMNDAVCHAVAAATGDTRFALDTHRRFIQMFGVTAMGIERKRFEEVFAALKKSQGIDKDSDVSGAALEQTIARFKEIYKESVGAPFPQDPSRQIALARDAVFRSWQNARAQAYRRLHQIADDLGTAVNIVEMVFGNMGWDSGTGVGFTRNPANGLKEFFGEYLANAQGEDVVSGSRTPKPLTALKEDSPALYKELLAIGTKLERHYRDMQDFEFTVEKGKLFMLQTRHAKRTAPACLRVAVDMAREGLISRQEALLRVEPGGMEEILRPVFDGAQKRRFKVLARGLPAGPGAAAGRVVFSAEEAVRKAPQEPVILVRPETTPDDIMGMAAASGILTAVGGMTSHAAVVGRGMGKVCVVGCAALEIDEERRQLRVDGFTIGEGDFISIDGFTGEVLEGCVPAQSSEIIDVLLDKRSPRESDLFGYYETLLDWARKSGPSRSKRRSRGENFPEVRANADTPSDAAMARRFGAKGIGLCRTEHMFFGDDRLPLVVGMILAESAQARERYLSELFKFQKEDFVAMLSTMEGLPVTIRTLDPPLHEFLPKSEAEAQKRAAALGVEANALWAKSLELSEVNPMLGFRGVRLGIVYPEITAMQGRAIFSAAAELRRQGRRALPEIMIPLVGFGAELRHQRELLERVRHETAASYKVALDDIAIGTMIEVPRAALCADQIARYADFFSFGTNDLTQMCLGFSRDDYGRFLQTYKENFIFNVDPFVSVDTEGVGQLIDWAVRRARQAKPGIKIGVCGEQGGDPASIAFFLNSGFDYISASAFRVPVARLAVARAHLERQKRKNSLRLPETR